MKNKTLLLSMVLLLISIFTINTIQKKSVDLTKLPEKVEESNGFQRWITNLKNKDFDIEADEFRLVEENEIYNTKWIKIYDFESEEAKELYENVFNEVEDQDKIVYSPSERRFVDYRDIARRDYKPTEVYFFGAQDNKLLDARIVGCSNDANCYFDRAFFLENSNEVFVVTEISFAGEVNLREGEQGQVCDITEICTYSFKIHVVDINKNSRAVYESEPFELNLSEKKSEL